MALTNQEAAALAASNCTTKQLAAVAAKYKTWLDAQDTQATAVLALIAVSRTSKSPDVVIANATAEYARIETDPPKITSVTPNTGTTGTAVTFLGEDFTGATAVSLGGVACTSVVVVDDKHITAVAGAHASGAVTASVTTPSGTGTKANAFTY